MTSIGFFSFFPNKIGILEQNRKIIETANMLQNNKTNKTSGKKTCIRKKWGTKQTSMMECV